MKPKGYLHTKFILNDVNLQQSSLLKDGFCFSSLKTPMKMRLQFTFLLIGLIALLHACQVSNSAEQTAAVAPPFSKMEIAPETYTVQAQKGASLTTPKGSTIHIPAGSLVDANGEPIDGNVEVSFTEYHTREDIVLSGIPMHYSEGDEDGYLVTAGMCTITASYQGSEVGIAPDKEIEIELASEYRGEGDVEFFALDEATGVWTKTGAPQAVENPARTALNNQVTALEDSVAPVVPRALDPNEPVLNFNETGVGLQQAGLNYSVWRYAGSDQDKNPLYKKAFRNNGYRLQKTERLFQETGLIRAHFEMGAYDEKDSFRIHDTLRVLLMPVAFGNELSKAQEAYEKALKAYQERQAALAKLQAEMQAMAKYRYGFSVRGWGTFNCDVFMRNAFATYNVIVKANGKPVPKGNICLLMANENESGTLNYQYELGASMRVFTESDFSMAVIVDDQVSIIKDVYNHPNVKFKGKELLIKMGNPTPVANQAELSHLLAEI